MEKFPEGGQMLNKGASDGSVYPVGGFCISGEVTPYGGGRI
jgi:hypothetical protein